MTDAVRQTALRQSSAEEVTPQSTRTGLVRLVLRPTTVSLPLGVVVAVSLIVAETLAVYLLKQSAAVNSLAVVFLLGVVLVSIVWGLWLAVATAAVSAVVFDYFYVPPVLEFTPTQPQDLVALGIFLVVALSTSALAGLARSRGAVAERAHVLAEQQAALRRVATLVAQGATTAEVFSAVATELARCAGVNHASLCRYESDGTVVVLAVKNDPGVTRLPVGGRYSVEGVSSASMVWRTGRAARVHSYEDAPGPTAARMRELGLRSGLGAPIVVDGRLWGVACVGSGRPEPMPPETEERVADFAELVATAIANATARDELIASRARIVAAADEARRRIERDLHDGAQQRLVSLGLQLRLAEGSVPPELRTLKEQLSATVSGLTAVSSDLQQISRGIHPAILSEGGLGSALKSLARRCPVPVILDVAVERRLPDQVEVATYYVVAEALTNAAKYAQASVVNVCAETKGANLFVSIRDDGIGGADSSKGSGILGLNDRVEVLGGHMQITSPPASGTSLHITIPLEGPASSLYHDWST